MIEDWDEVERDFRVQVGDVEGISLDRAHLERMAREVASGHMGLEANRVRGRVEPVRLRDLDRLEKLEPRELERLRALGSGALERGEVAAAVLNGGMATRFGGVVKGTVPVLGSRSFLELKLSHARRLCPAPLVVMNSFATHTATARFLAERGIESGVEAFLQGVSLRLTPQGELFRDGSGRVSLYAPGHGDFPEFARSSGTLGRLRERGVRALMLSNVDNLGAVLDETVVGYHLSHGRPLTVELAESAPGDSGGAPAFVDGALQIVEGFRWPRDFEFARLEVINTNTFTLSLELLEQVHPWTWFYVEKTVDGRPAVQLERLVNELSARVETEYLVTPRGGAKGRFFPAKTPEDLDRIRADPELAARFAHL